MTQKKEWTKDERYLPYTEWSENYIIGLEEKVSNSPYRLNYHIQPNSGLLNDPNGFSFFNGKWQLFYQSYPFGPVHGLKSWHHLTSVDLIHWQDEGLALTPSTDFDSHGVYSGSATPIDDKLFLFYTGNVRDEKWQRYTYQNGAFMDKDGEITKINTPLIEQPEQYTDHFRDPMVFYYNQKLFAIIGAQDKSEKGKIALYKAKNNQPTVWLQNGELTFTKDELGFMIECPNLVFIDEQPVLLFCPQGLDKRIEKYENIYPNMYIIGTDFNPETGKINQTSHMQNLDDGFDVYATQAFNAPDGRVLSVGWIGLPDIEYPTDFDGWAHCLSLVRELSLTNGKLYQYPVMETKKLRLEEIETQLEGLVVAPSNNAYELELTVPTDETVSLTLYSDKEKSIGLTLNVDSTNGTIELNREKSGQTFAEAFGNIRTSTVEKNQLVKLNIFADTSVVEIFVNNGEKVLTSRVFPAENQHFIHANKVLTATMWPLANAGTDFTTEKIAKTLVYSR